jgi:hypothetical protein
MKGEGGWWRKLHSEELHYFHFHFNNITIIESRRMRWICNTHKEVREMHTSRLSKQQKGRNLGTEMDLREIMNKLADWIKLDEIRIQLRRWPTGSTKEMNFLTSWTFQGRFHKVNNFQMLCRAQAFMLTVLARLTLWKKKVFCLIFLIQWYSIHWNTAELIR